MNDPSPTHPPDGPPSGAGELLPAFLVLLPALALAWPAPSPIEGDFATGELSGAGVALLFALPAAVLVAWRRPRPFRGLSLLLCTALALSLAPHATESLQETRVWIGLATGLVVALAAGSLGAGGRRRLVRGAAVASILLVGPALVEGGPGWGGVLGNSGELSGAALPGALAGLLLWARGRGSWAWIGFAAIGLFGVHATRAPVLASLLALLLVTAAAAALGWKRLEASGRVKLALALLLTFGGFGWVRWGPTGAAPEAPDTRVAAAPDAPGPTTTGGIEVRRRIWRATWPMVREHPLAGVGAGQFSTAFPPYRDPEEIELSSWQRRIEQNTEVEHPHSDWLVFLVEGGVAGGAAWSAFLLLVAWLGLRSFRGGAASSAIGAGALGTLVGALFNAPLSFNPTASALSFALFGALLVRESSVRPSRFAPLLGPAAALMLLLLVPRAFGMWGLGRAMSEFAGTQSVTAKEIAVEDALAACPDSVVALTLHARFREQKHRDLAGALASWDRVLALRPHRFEALLQRGVVLARLGRFGEASESFDRALQLDAGHPGLIRNRANCFADRGLVEKAMAEIDRLEALGHYRAEWLGDLGFRLILRGKDREALPLLARADDRFAELTGEVAWELDREYRVGGSQVAADAFKALAHLLWGRAHAAEGRWDDARRSYRQALRVTRDHVAPKGPLRNRMEFAAVLWRSGRTEEARVELEGLEPRLADWASMPIWAGEALLEMGFGVERDE